MNFTACTPLLNVHPFYELRFYDAALLQQPHDAVDALVNVDHCLRSFEEVNVVFADTFF
ncbi:MAG: hypothetical protein IH898_10940 [Planctomycetes bacterium]|nr:hypothetical protein [Planctomycetota bacterium]